MDSCERELNAALGRFLMNKWESHILAPTGLHCCHKPPGRPLRTSRGWLDRSCQTFAISAVPQIVLLFLQFGLPHRHCNTSTCQTSDNCGVPGPSCGMCWPGRLWLTSLWTSDDSCGGACRSIAGCDYSCPLKTCQTRYWMSNSV